MDFFRCAGLGAQWKAKIGELQERDLEDDDFAQRWDSNSMTASEKRVKLSHWAGEAWVACCKDRKAMRRYLEKAGAMMTADGTGDELIALEGMPKDYQYEFMHVEIDTADPDEDDLEGEEEGTVAG